MSLLYDHTPITLTARVIHGLRDGPRLFVSAAVHGDELNGVEIIRRLLNLPRLSRLRGTLVAVPVVNVYGFIGNTRYLPDRRDLNRSFPGTSGGSLASQLAHVFMREVVARCTHGIDLHTGAIHRTNFPQIRGDLSNDEVKRLARAFSAPLVLNAALRDGSLRKAAMEQGVPTLVYEAGEALRFDEAAINVGVRGIVRVMQELGMFGKAKPKPLKAHPVSAASSYWVRSPVGGVSRAYLADGARINEGDQLGTIADPFGEKETAVTAGDAGILIGRNNLPVVNQGDGLFHIARVVDPDKAEQVVEQFRDEIEQNGDVDHLETF